MLSTFHLIHNYVVMIVISKEPNCSLLSFTRRVELGYNVMKGTEYFVSL
jgi:hypothetical protein